MVAWGKIHHSGVVFLPVGNQHALIVDAEETKLHEARQSIPEWSKECAGNEKDRPSVETFTGKHNLNYEWVEENYHDPAVPRVEWSS